MSSDPRLRNLARKPAVGRIVLKEDIAVILCAVEHLKIVQAAVRAVIESVELYLLAEQSANRHDERDSYQEYAKNKRTELLRQKHYFSSRFRFARLCHSSTAATNEGETSAKPRPRQRQLNQTQTSSVADVTGFAARQ